MTMSTDTKKIYNATDRALVVLTDDGGPGFASLTVKSVTLAPGDTMTITPATIEANRDATGFSWLSLTEDEQRDRWGRLRFGVGEPPKEVRARVAATRRAQLVAERADLMSRVPRSLDRSRYLSGRVDKIDAEIAALDKEIAA
jgi:hypothetical protein